MTLNEDIQIGDFNPGDEPVLDAYFVIDAPLAGNMRADYLLPNEAQAESKTRQNILAAEPSIALQTGGFALLKLPSRATLLDITITAALRDAVRLLVVRIQVCARDIPFFRNLAASNPAGRVTGAIRGFGIEAQIAGGGYWNQGFEGGRGFGSRLEAEALIGASAEFKERLTGEGVNVVLMDSGLDEGERRQLNLNYGLSHKGTQHCLYLPEAPPAPRYDHAWYTARHVKALAPHARVHDYAVLPPRLSHALIPSVMAKVSALISDIVEAYLLLEQQITEAKSQSDAPWVVINAWALYRRPPSLRDDVTAEELQLAPNERIRSIIDNEPKQMDLDDRSAYFNVLIDQMVKTLNVDFVFAAGNCGFASLDPRCGLEDRGPGRSILGPAGHPAVTTVSACRNDMTWIGSSSQGPANMANALVINEKPDFAAPSCFFDDSDAARLYSGTSTACAVAGASIAALRQAHRTYPPDKLKQAIVNSVRKVPPGDQQESRFGAGILNLEETLRSIS